MGQATCFSRHFFTSLDMTWQFFGEPDQLTDDIFITIKKSWLAFDLIQIKN